MASAVVSDFGVTVAFSTTATNYAPLLRGLSYDGAERNVIDTSHLGLTAYDTKYSAFRTKAPGGLIEPGTWTFDVVWDFGDEPPIASVAETLTITFTGSGSVTTATFAMSGFVTGYTITAGDDTTYEGQFTWQQAGEPTWTASG